MNIDNDLPNSSGDLRSPSSEHRRCSRVVTTKGGSLTELVVEEATRNGSPPYQSQTPLPQKKNKKRYFPNFDYIRKLFVSTKLDQTSPVALPPSKLVVKRLKAPCQTSPVAKLPSELVVEGYKEHKPPDKKKEIEVIFSGRKFIHGQRSQSVSSLGHNIDNIVIRHSATNVSAHIISQAMLSSSNIFGAIRTPNSYGSKATFEVSSKEAIRRVSPLPKSSASEACFGLSSSVRSAPCPNSSGDLQSPSELAEEVGIEQYNIMNEIGKGHTEHVASSLLSPEQAKLAEDLGKGQNATELLTSKGQRSNWVPASRVLSAFHPEKLGEPEKWVPPDTHGLNNSDRIIPTYYLPSNMNRHNVLRVDYHYMILDDIRNVRPLNKYQLDYIKNSLHESDKQKIIEEFNNVIMSYGEVLLNDQ
uniref:Uncharacterized protein n=1 Tax=viral metagenome TaxID=1070528 RepID=A0A6C0IBL1_9ZZZZ